MLGKRQAKDLVDNNTVVVVVDTNKPSYTECQDLLYLTRTCLLYTSIFISQYGCPSYFKHCELLLYSKKENELRKECRDLLEE